MSHRGDDILERMAEHRSQHYVPQFLLKQFASDAGRKHVCLFRIGDRRSVARASIRDQCARDFFYGADGELEKTFAGLEAEASRVLYGMTRADIVPEPFSEDLEIFRLFALTLWSRTPTAIGRLEAEMTGYVREIAKVDRNLPPGGRESLKGLRVSVSPHDGLAMQLDFAARFSPAVADLRLKVLRSATPAEFVVGDAPVVLHNQWMRRVPIGSCGFANAGLQIVLPLSPTSLALFYDTDIYEVGPVAQDVVPVDNPHEVQGFNQLQYAAAESNLYFRSLATAEQLANLPEMSRVNPFGLEVAKFKEHGGKSALVMTSHVPLSVDLRPGAVRIRHEKAIIPRHERFEHANRWRPESMAVVDRLAPPPQRSSRGPREGALFEREDD